jgi:hypothetical protein
MKKIELAEILDLTAYEKARESMRTAVMALKVHRRTSLGDHLTVLFENRETVLFQIQEMVRTERIVEDAKIQDELDTYNALVPDEGELSATLFIEIPDISRMNHDQQIAAVNRFQGLDRDSIFLVIGDRRIPAVFEEGRTKEEKMSAVHFLRFAIPLEVRAALERGASPLKLLASHPHYAAEAPLDEAFRAELVRDLK